ncbi:MAG: hypothetical protein ACTS27_11860 [Phycisphaerales bacterium]
MAKRLGKRWTKRRVLVRIGALLVLGFIVNVLVAWGFAARSAPSWIAGRKTEVIKFADIAPGPNGLAVMTRATNYSSMTIETDVGAWRASTRAQCFDVPDMLAGKMVCPGCVRPVDHPDIHRLRGSWRWRLVLSHAWLPHRCNASDSKYQAVRSMQAFGWPFPSVVYARGGEISGEDVWRADLILWPSTVQPGYAALALNADSGFRLLSAGDLALNGGASYTAIPSLNRYSRTTVLPIRPVITGAVINTIVYASFPWLLFYGVPIGRVLLRRKKGRCTMCGYDLGHDYAAGCPECGWNRQDTHSADVMTRAS